ncbi:hypothetical protein tinsulaeT_25600 [Thalassotalea insulae]|uniref:Solute-binding protein family 3/N-terminal domain-containing protein n=1 Tax=Thalassotalea insulae TaxID=2056778 RepID=A0ABQ6GWW7_9GAMM|nr:TIGR02285 family protein [Thalassotalea insulae]GLX79220.1 hypothetical protein tinsulaeT_25600 [Thalassotalea insulae]
MKYLLLFIGLLYYHVNVLAQETINWYHPNFPPANFVEGLMEGLGHNDQAEKFIASHMPNYNHNYITASYQRIIHNLKFNQGCSVGISKNPEREKKLFFSIPYLLTFPNGVIIKEEQFKQFSRYLEKNGTISVKRLLNDERLIAGIADGRKYQSFIDMELERHRSKDNIMVRSSTDVFSGLLQMLDRERIDYIFGFPEELAYHTSLGVLENKMQFIPISEMPRFLTSYVVCSKTRSGQKAIDEINLVLTKYRTTPEFLRFYEFWLDFDSKKRHKRISLTELSSSVKKAPLR